MNTLTERLKIALSTIRNGSTGKDSTVPVYLTEQEIMSMLRAEALNLMLDGSTQWYTED